MDDDLPSGSVWPGVLVALGVMALLALALVLLSPFLMRAKSPSKRSRCANNLRQLGLAAASYAGDKRFYPHVAGLKLLDGDWQTQDALRVYEALFHLGYLDDTRVMTCPSSGDPEQGPTPGGPWAFVQAPPAWRPFDVSRPLATPGTLATVDHVSYGWTRRAMPLSVSGRRLLGADRALQGVSSRPGPAGTRGNHADGWHVVHADAAIRFLSVDATPSPFLTLGATSGPDAGHLAMEWAGADPAGKSP